MDPALADIAVDVVLGHQSPHRLAVEKIVATRPHTTLYAPQPSLAGLIARPTLRLVLVVPPSGKDLVLVCRLGRGYCCKSASLL